MPLTYHRRRTTVRFFSEPLGPETALEMMQIPAGSFLMGSSEDELERFDDEGPQHQVTVASFFMGKYPVTQAQWAFVARLPQVQRELDINPSQFKGENRPVEQVSWYDAVEFCDRLSVYTQRQYRLPTEAEWEYACRAGTTTPFHFGETITTELANYCGEDREIQGTVYKGSYGSGPLGSYRQETTDVDHFNIANPWGLCDMHGNVWEWCQDHWHNSYEGAPMDGGAWLTNNKDASKVLCGGSWLYFPRYCRSASRYYITPAVRLNSVGFRIVCVAPRAPQ